MAHSESAQNSTRQTQFTEFEAFGDGARRVSSSTKSHVNVVEHTSTEDDDGRRDEEDAMIAFSVFILFTWRVRLLLVFARSHFRLFMEERAFAYTKIPTIRAERVAVGKKKIVENAKMLKTKLISWSDGAYPVPALDTGCARGETDDAHLRHNFFFFSSHSFGKAA